MSSVYLTPQVARICHKEVIKPATFTVVSVKQEDVKDAATPTFVMELQPTRTSESTPSVKDEWQTTALLMTKELNKMALAGIIGSGAILELQDYVHADHSSSDHVALKVQTLKVLSMSREIADIFADDDDDAPVSVSTTVSTTVTDSSAPKRCKTSPVKQEVPVRIVANDSDDSDDSEDEDGSSKPSRWKYTHQLEVDTNRWKVLVRVLFCDKIKSGRYNDPDRKGEWRLQVIRLIDGKGDIIAIELRDGMIERWGPYFNPGILLTISNVAVKLDKQDSRYQIHKYVLSIDSRKERSDYVVFADENPHLYAGQVLVPKQFPVTRLADLSSCDEKAIVSVVGVVLQVSAYETPISKAGKKYGKRMITIRDHSNTDTQLGLMYHNQDVPKGALEFTPAYFGLGADQGFDATENGKATNIDYSKLPVIFILNAAVSRFGGGLSLDWKASWMTNRPTCMWVGADGRKSQSSRQSVDQDNHDNDSEDGESKPASSVASLPEALALRAWLESQRGQLSTAAPLHNKRPTKPSDPYSVERFSIDKLKTLQPEYLTYVNMKVHLDKIIYDAPNKVYQMSCPVVLDKHPFVCSRALQIGDVHDVCKDHGEQPKGTGRPTFRMDVLFQDESGARSFRVFNEVAEKLLQGKTALELHRMYEQGRLDEMEQLYNAALTKEWVVLATAGMSAYSQQQSVDIKIAGASEPNVAKEIELANAQLAAFPTPALAGSAISTSTDYDITDFAS